MLLLQWLSYGYICLLAVFWKLLTSDTRNNKPNIWSHMRVLLGKVQPNRLFNTCSFEFSLPDPDPDDDVHPLVLLGLPRPQRGGRWTRSGGGNLGGVGGPGERSTGVGVLVKTIGPFALQNLLKLGHLSTILITKSRCL